MHIKGRPIFNPYFQGNRPEQMSQHNHKSKVIGIQKILQYFSFCNNKIYPRFIQCIFNTFNGNLMQMFLNNVVKVVQTIVIKQLVIMLDGVIV